MLKISRKKERKKASLIPQGVYNLREKVAELLT